MAKMKLKKDDQVLVIAGKDKGKTGQVLRVKPDENRVVVAGVNMAKKAVRANQQTGEIQKVSPSTNRVVVAGVNLIKKATKPDPQTQQGGGLIEKEAPIHASNVMFLDPATGKGTRKRPQ